MEVMGDNAEITVTKNVVADNGKTYQLSISALEVVEEYEDEYINE